MLCAFARDNRNGRSRLLLLCILAMASPARAGQSVGDVTPNTAVDTGTLGKGQGLGIFNDPDFLVVPIPISNPTIGSGAALAGAMLFKTDAQSSSSMIGAAAFRTSNGSWGGGAVASFAFDEDRYRAKLSLGYADILYDFYGVGQAAVEKGRFISINQGGDLVQASFQTRIAPHLYAGLQARYMNIKTAFNLPDLAGTLLDNGGPLSKIDDLLNTVGLVATYDSRNRDYSPNAGQLIDGEIDFGSHNFIQSNGFTRTTADYNRYDALNDDLVLASHGSLCMANGSVPIFDLCLFGSSNDLRGYAVGKYQDKAMFTEQEELRWHAFWRIGFVAFAGIGSVAPSADRFGDILASAGVGMRFLASKDYGINVGIDGAVTKEGDKAFYIQVGEAF
jgi:outer membrane protein assembly factor BamA